MTAIVTFNIRMNSHFMTIVRLVMTYALTGHSDGTDESKDRQSEFMWCDMSCRSMYIHVSSHKPLEFLHMKVYWQSYRVEVETEPPVTAFVPASSHHIADLDRSSIDSHFQTVLAFASFFASFHLGQVSEVCSLLAPEILLARSRGLAFGELGSQPLHMRQILDFV